MFSKYTVWMINNFYDCAHCNMRNAHYHLSLHSRELQSPPFRVALMTVIVIRRKHYVCFLLRTHPFAHCTPVTQHWFTETHPSQQVTFPQ